MLIFDYNGLALGSILIQKELNVDLIRHMILNTIRMYRVKFPRSQYGDVIIACDGSSNWRRGAYPQYKANRRKNREQSTFDWNEAFRILNMIREELRDNFPYKLIHIDGCEADDIIGTLAYNTAEFGQYEDVMIISADKDFTQLQKLDNVKQFSPITKKFVVEKNPKLFALTHIIKGDAGDGVPNILSSDDCLVEGIRQTPISQKKLDVFIEAVSNGTAEGETWYRNFQRNQRLIDLNFTPEHLKTSIIEAFNVKPSIPGSAILPYLINKKCKLLIEVASEFN